MVVLPILSSCIQSEAPNAEADILVCIVPEDILKKDPQIENDIIICTPKADADLNNISITFELTPGATIEPPSGTPRDFTTPQTYEVTSEDRKWKKTYTIYFNPTDLQTQFSFENYELAIGGKYEYYRFYEEKNGDTQYIWATGNAPLVIVFGTQGPDAYPSVSYENGKIGRCIKLETKKVTGFAGVIAPMAAGNLFIGEFINATAMTDPLGSTHFGVPFTREPIAVTGYYKYKRGEKFYNGKPSVENPNKKDIFDLYAVMYETDDEVKYLDGHNSLTSPNIVAIAQIQEQDKVVYNFNESLDEVDWVPFNIPFILKPGKEINQDKLLLNKYNISLVCSSSVDGAVFSGAIGSTLLIDETEIHCKD